MKKPLSSAVMERRAVFLDTLRHGQRPKGSVASDETTGDPIIATTEDSQGACACAIAGEMYGVTRGGRISLPKAMQALGLNSSHCRYIQRNLNDTPLTMPQIADRIETDVFKAIV